MATVPSNARMLRSSEISDNVFRRSLIGTPLQLSSTPAALVADPASGAGSNEVCLAAGKMGINRRNVAVYIVRDIPKHTDITEPAASLNRALGQHRGPTTYRRDVVHPQCHRLAWRICCAVDLTGNP